MTVSVNFITLYVGGVPVQVIEGSQLHFIYAGLGATTQPPTAIPYVRPDPFPQYVHDEEIADLLADAAVPATDPVVAALVANGGSATRTAIDAATAAVARMVVAEDVADPQTDIGGALQAAFAPRTHVVVDPDGSGNYETLAEALAAHPGGDVHIELTAGEHSLGATISAVGVENVTISGQGRDATTLTCTAGFIDAQATAGVSGACNQWTIHNLFVRHVDGTNTDDGIKVDYPRRWMVRDLRMAGFGGSSIWYRGGLHSWIERNIISARDSTDTNGYAGIRVDLSSGGVVPTTIITRSNYVEDGVQYGFYFQQTNVGCVFEGDIAEKCAVGFRFDLAVGVLIAPYTEANTVGIELHDSLLPIIGRLRDEPVCTWSSQATVDRRPMRIGRNWINPGKAIIYGNTTGPASDPSTAPSIRWGTGSPEGVHTAVLGSIFIRTDVGQGRTIYTKESGTGNTGWVASGVNGRTSAQLNSATDPINTAGKTQGTQVFNTTVNRPVWATGISATTTWVYADGTVAHTPV